MISALAALVLSAAPAVPLQAFTADVLQKKKTKPKPKEKEKEKEAPAETSPGLDLTAPAPAPDPAPEPPPSDTPSVTEEAKDKPAAAGGTFSIVGPRTVGEGANVVEAALGWPGIYAGYWRGILTSLDVGARVGFNWGYEGQIPYAKPGLRIQVQARYLFLEKDKLSIGATLAPGLLVYFFAKPLVGLVVPITGVVGYQLMEKLNVAAMLEIPFWVAFGVGAVVPLMLGVGGEYFLNDSLALQAKVKGGVSIWLNGASAAFTLEAFVGAAYRL